MKLLIAEISENLERMRGAASAANLSIRKLRESCLPGDSQHDELAVMIHTCQEAGHMGVLR